MTPRILKASAIVALAIACSLPATAQNTTPSGSTATRPLQSQGDDDFDMGWLGLLGLIGLAGLKRRDDVQRR